MLDDLRGNDDSMDFLDEEEQDPFAFEEEAVADDTLLLGMTPIQRFVIAVMILFMACLLSSFCLLVTEKITLPFM
jgi:hypothetical protein